MLRLFKHLTVVLVTLSFTVFANNPVRVALTPIAQVLEQGDSSLPYSKLIEVMQQRLDVTTSYDYMQSDRAIRLFDAGKLDCVFPTMKFDSQQQPIEFSEPINGVALHLFSLGKTYRSLSELEHKLVVHLRGYEFTREASQNPNVGFFSASEHKLAMEMLKNGRASAYLAYFPDIRLLAADFNTQLQYQKTAPLYKSYDSFQCSNSQTSKYFLQQVNKLLRQLKSSGELKSMLGAYYEPVLAQD